MGTVSIDNSSLEERLAAIESEATSIKSNTSILNRDVGDLLSSAIESVKQLKILNLHQSEITGNELTKEDVT